MELITCIISYRISMHSLIVTWFMIIVLCVFYPPDEYNQLNLKLSMSTGKDIWEKCLTQPRTLRKLQKLMSFFLKSINVIFQTTQWCKNQQIYLFKVRFTCFSINVKANLSIFCCDSVGMLDKCWKLNQFDWYNITFIYDF